MIKAMSGLDSPGVMGYKTPTNFKNIHMLGKKTYKSTIIAAFAFILLVISLISICSAEVTFEDEKKIGREIYDNLNRSNQLLKDERITGYLNDVGNKILAGNKKVPFDFQFSVVKSSAINAFATPGGFVFVNAGLITLVNNESELAGVLSHEIAHVNSRHVAQMIAKQKTMTLATLGAILAGAILGGGGTGTAATMGFSLATAAHLSLQYSREFEEEADRLGLQYLVSAGYDPHGMPDFLKIMKSYEFFSSSIPSYFLTHPGTEDRLIYIDGLLQTKYVNQGKRDIFGKLGRIQTLLVLGDKSPEQSLKYFQGKMEKAPGNVDFQYGAAVSLARLGKANEALELFGKLLKVVPGDTDVLKDTGFVYYDLGRMNDAIPYLKKAHSMESGSARNNDPSWARL